MRVMQERIKKQQMQPLTEIRAPLSPIVVHPPKSDVMMEQVDSQLRELSTVQVTQGKTLQRIQESLGEVGAAIKDESVLVEKIAAVVVGQVSEKLDGFFFLSFHIFFFFFLLIIFCVDVQ